MQRALAHMQVDREVALCRVGDDWALLQEVAQLFLDHCDPMLTEIRTAIDSRNPAALELAAHSLKGSVSNFGCADTTKAALTLELRGRGQNWEDIEDDYAALVRSLAVIRPELEALIQSEAP